MASFLSAPDNKSATDTLHPSKSHPNIKTTIKFISKSIFSLNPFPPNLHTVSVSLFGCLKLALPRKKLIPAYPTILTSLFD